MTHFWERWLEELQTASSGNEFIGFPNSLQVEKTTEKEVTDDEEEAKKEEKQVTMPW